jgi:acyl CoA:acetate/3-ketoacid CoA transferase alpha subunit
MINKISASVQDALATIKDGATVMIGGFGKARRTMTSSTPASSQ